MQSSRRFQKVLATKKFHQDTLLATPGVHGVGIGQRPSSSGQDEYFIQIFFDEALVTSDAVEIKRMLPQSLDGVATTIIETGQFSNGAERAFAPSPAPLVDQAKYRPVPPGCQIAIVNQNNTLSGGTLGCFALTNDTVVPIPVLISNQHVLHIADALIYQPVNNKHDDISKVVRQALTPTVDAAAGVIKAGVTTTNMIAGTAISITGTGAPQLNQFVAKRGRSTEYTSGPVASVSFSGVTVEGWRFEEQAAFGAQDGPTVSQQGDSGSPVLAPNGTMATMVGLLWGSSGQRGNFAAFTPLHFVTDALKISILTGGGDREPVAQTDEGARIAAAAAALQSIPAGKAMVDVYREHDAFRKLVKGNPAVEVAWARAYSCNIITAILNWILDGEAPFPTVLNGVDMQDLFDGLEAAFMYHGDENIRAIVKRIRGQVRLAVGKSWGDYLKALHDYDPH